MNKYRGVCIFLMSASLMGCGSKTWKVGGTGIVSGLAGAGLGYTVVHHGPEREHRLTNTIISGSILAVLGAGIAYWHLTSLENQKVELAGQFSRSQYLESSDRTGELRSVQIAVSGKKSLSLDPNTRWVFPEFRKRTLPPQRGESEIISSHYTWEIARPGFFVTREQYPTLFKEEEMENE